MFEDTQRAVKQNKLKTLVSRAGLSAPSTAIPPTSALAARIAVSNPADAVRASSVDAGRTMQPGELPDPPPTAITATLRRADELRRAQEMQIQATQHEENRRKSLALANNAPMIGVGVSCSTGTLADHSEVLSSWQTVNKS